MEFFRWFARSALSAPSFLCPNLDVFAGLKQEPLCGRRGAGTVNWFGARVSVGIPPHSSPFWLSVLSSVVARSSVVILMFSVCDPSHGSVQITHPTHASRLKAQDRSAEERAHNITLGSLQEQNLNGSRLTSGVRKGASLSCDTCSGLLLTSQIPALFTLSSTSSLLTTVRCASAVPTKAKCPCLVLVPIPTALHLSQMSSERFCQVQERAKHQNNADQVETSYSRRKQESRRLSPS